MKPNNIKPGIAKYTHLKYQYQRGEQPKPQPRYGQPKFPYTYNKNARVSFLDQLQALKYQREVPKAQNPQYGQPFPSYNKNERVSLADELQAIKRQYPQSEQRAQKPRYCRPKFPYKYDKNARVSFLDQIQVIPYKEVTHKEIDPPTPKKVPIPYRLLNEIQLLRILCLIR
jgi:hypothetical protein